MNRRVGDDFLEPQEVPGRLRRVWASPARLAGSSSGDADENGHDADRCAIVPSTAMAARRTRSGTAFTVVSGASSVDARITGDVPARDSQQRVGLGGDRRRSAAASRERFPDRRGRGRRPSARATCDRRRARRARRQDDRRAGRKSGSGSPARSCARQSAAHGPCCPTHGIDEAMLVPTVTAQNASWSHGSR